MFQRLLLGIDDTSAGQVGVSFATALARQNSASVHVLYVNQLLIGGRGHTVLSAIEAHHLVDGALEELAANGIEATGAVQVATCYNMASRIVDAAYAWSADAIVLGSHRHHRLHRLLGQGIRERVIQTSALPVLTAPAPLKVGTRVQPPGALTAPPNRSRAARRDR